MALVSTFRELNKCFTEPLTLSGLRRIFLLLVRAHYGDPDNFGNLKSSLQCLTYDPENPGTSPLTIELGSIVGSKLAAGRPAIYVDYPGDLKWVKSGIGNVAGHSFDNSETNLSWGVVAPIVISHVSDSIDLSLNMAESTAGLVLGLSQHLIETLNLSSLEAEGLNFPKPNPNAVERYYRVDLSLRVRYNFNMSVNLESHRLKKFALELNSA